MRSGDSRELFDLLASHHEKAAKPVDNAAATQGRETAPTYFEKPSQLHGLAPAVMEPA